MAETQTLLIQAIEHQNAGHLDEAAADFKAVLALDPANGPAFYSLGLMAMQGGDMVQARHWSLQGVSAAPYFAPLRYLLASVLQKVGDFDNALQQFDAALVLQPDYQEVLLNSGALLRTLHRHKDALERFNRILAINPSHPGALANAGILLTEFKQSELAIQLFRRLLQLAPDYEYALGLLFYEKMLLADWTDYQKLRALIQQGISEGRPVCKSLAFMSVSDQAQAHFQAAKMFGQRYCPPAPQKLWNGERYEHRRLRLAYVSPDFREHPVCHLMAGVIEQHDRSRFELFAVSLGIDDGSRLRTRMLNAFDHFLDARAMSSEQVARWMRDHEIDVAVDLGGYTADTRSQIFSFRPAPVQVNYLGYPGTMGVDYMDYILADRYVIPPEHMKYYQERVVHLPGTYLPIDSTLKISPHTPTREACGLPAQGFVFCSFSHDYKITPDVFDVWMRLLVKVPGSVLWLASKGEITRQNLRKEAEARGVAAGRLVFADRTPHVEDHLARYRLADLFLDTYPYNAHTTAADALMAGLPVLTLEGHSFPSRVASGLLQSAGLSHLVTHSWQAYEERAVSFAAEYQQRPAQERSNLAPRLKSSADFARDLELAYLSMSRVLQQGLASDELYGKVSA